MQYPAFNSPVKSARQGFASIFIPYTLSLVQNKIAAFPPELLSTLSPEAEVQGLNWLFLGLRVEKVLGRGIQGRIAQGKKVTADVERLNS